MTVRVGTPTSCGIDLHVLKGDAPTAGSGGTLGREIVGSIAEVGPEVRA